MVDHFLVPIIDRRMSEKQSTGSKADRTRHQPSNNGVTAPFFPQYSRYSENKRTEKTLNSSL
jgi:hypothetical protein